MKFVKNSSKTFHIHYQNMERTKSDLESTIKSQKEQLLRYEKRLKDIVTAYKGLLKEKEALESSLAAFNTNQDSKTNATKIKDISEGSATTTSTKPNGNENGQEHVNEIDGGDRDGDVNLKTQIHTLMNSLATLSAEKSRMEASFQTDKKQLRAQLMQKDAQFADLQVKMKEVQEQAKSNLDEMKAKWLIERQERDKETNNQMVMIRELQKLYADERHLKENIEMQLNNFKTQFASNEAENSHVRQLESQLKEAQHQLKMYQEEASRLDKCNNANNNEALLKQVQQEMQRMKEQHAIAIKMEQQRVQLAEEQSRQQVVLHENRVVNLEARLAELSATVGNYDRLRQQDQEAILVLKQQLQDLEKISHSNENEMFTDNRRRRRKKSYDGSCNDHDIDVPAIVDEIMHLKKILLKNHHLHANQIIELEKIFTITSPNSMLQHSAKLEQDNQLNGALRQLANANSQITELEEKIAQQKNHIATLQDKVQVLNGNIEEQEQEMKQYHEKLLQAVKEERKKWQEAYAELENDQRCKLNELEQQLHKQRQRSLQLLEEKEQEIKTLQTSYEIFHNNNNNNNLMHPMALGHLNDDGNVHFTHSDAESGDNDDQLHSSLRAIKKLTMKTKRLSMGGNCHMLHYANEIARKDIEIANLRKAKYLAETSMRKAIQDKVTAQEELNNKIINLQEEVDRLERCKTREGANLEYLKNVIISYIVSKDPDGRRHMMNAISAVLQFTGAEMQTINAALHKK